MAVISFTSSKGGAGKTTSSVILAGELVRSGATVTLVDADPNQPLVKWAQLANLPTGLSVAADESADTIETSIEQAREQARFVIVDLEGTASDRTSFAIGVSDLILIPLQGSVLDANEAIKSLGLIRRMSKIARRDIKFSMFFSKAPAALREKTYRDIEAQLIDKKVPLLQTDVVDRAAYRALFSFGGTLEMLTSSDVSGLDAARDNAHLFASEILALLTQRKTTEAA